MLMACSRCGRIHEWGKCPAKKERRYCRTKERTNEMKFRSTAEWQKKVAEVRRRDAGLCKLCLYEGRINGRDLSIHHIDPIRQNPDRKLDNDNLITLCREHHQLVESDPGYIALLFVLARTLPKDLLHK